MLIVYTIYMPNTILALTLSEKNIVYTISNSMKVKHSRIQVDVFSFRYIAFIYLFAEHIYIAFKLKIYV